MKEYDVVVLGGGSGGCASAIRSADLGKKVVIVEYRDKDGIGGTCINRGCIPAKALLKSASVYSEIKESKAFGIKTENVTYSLKDIMRKKNSVVKNMRFGLKNFILKPRDIEVMQGLGRIIDNNTVEVKTKDGVETLKAENIVVAVGSEPAMIPAFNIDHKNIITSDEALELKELPKDIVIVGAGAIGIEFAVFMSSFGTKVTIVEMLPNIAATLKDDEMSKVVEDILKKKGIEIITEVKIENLEVVEEGKIKASLSNGESVEAEKALISIGRKLNVDGLGVEELGIEMENRRIKVDSQMKTNVKNIFAVGDVVQGPQLSHKAQREGVVVGEVIAGLDTTMNYDVVPWAIFSKPEIAAVGMSESQAKEKGIETIIGSLPFMANEKANTMQETDGMVKIVANKSNNEIIGAQIVGPEASILIAELALAVQKHVTMEEVSNIIHAHPTLSEAVMESCKNGMGKAFHISAKK